MTADINAHKMTSPPTVRYEISNPSDECYLEHSNRKAAIAACLLLGDGRYGLKTENGDLVLPILLFGGTRDFIDETYGSLPGYETFLAEHMIQIAEALESVSYARERTSMNDIKSKADKIARLLRDKNPQAT